MAENYDSRVAFALLKLGYRIFPFEAFDSSGELKTPDRVSFPPDISDGLGAMVSSPLWRDIYRTLSPLRASDKIFMAGLALVGDRIQVALFKSTNTVVSANAAMHWAESYHGTVEESLYRYAGNSYLVDPNWRPVLEKARGSLSATQLDVMLATPGSEFQTETTDSPSFDKNMEVVASVPWLMFALELLLEIVSKAMVRRKVLTTIVWYPPTVADNVFASNWKPIHANLQAGVLSGHRSAHLIWNPVGLPVTWRGNDVAWRGPGFDMPHEPAQWCQALRPEANCLNRTSLDDLDEQTVAPSKLTWGPG